MTSLRWIPYVNGAARDRQGPTVIEVVLRNFKGEVMVAFSKSVGVSYLLKIPMKQRVWLFLGL